MAALDEIYVTFPSLLMMDNREKDAITALEKAESICTHLSQNLPLLKKTTNFNMIH